MPATTTPAKSRQFVDHCCDLLHTQGSCLAKRMFGGWSISIDEMTFAIISDLGGGDKLWLKADDSVRSRFEAVGCGDLCMLGQPRRPQWVTTPHPNTPWTHKMPCGRGRVYRWNVRFEP